MRRSRRRDVLAAATALALGLRTGASHAQETPMHPDLILVNGRITTLDRASPQPEARRHRGRPVQRGRRRARYHRRRRPGDQGHRSRRPPRHPRPDRQPHCTSSAAASTTTWSCAGTACRRSPTRMAMLKEQARRTPPPQWVRVVGGFTEHPVRREAPADAGRDQRGRARHAGLHPASLRPRAAQPRRAARRRLHQGHARTRRAARSQRDAQRRADRPAAGASPTR